MIIFSTFFFGKNVGVLAKTVINARPNIMVADINIVTGPSIPTSLAASIILKFSEISLNIIETFVRVTIKPPKSTEINPVKVATRIPPSIPPQKPIIIPANKEYNRFPSVIKDTNKVEVVPASMPKITPS